MKGKFQHRFFCAVGGICILVGTAAAFQRLDQRTKTVTAGSKYRASILHCWLLGRDYRELWLTPIRAEVLDLETYAGGLTPMRRVGGMQTLGLAIRGADGRNFTFRGVDKDPTSFLPKSFADTLAERIMQDQTAAAHPAGAVIVPPIAEAAGVLHTEPRLVVMPDSERLKEFQEDFAGALGTFEEYPTARSPENPGFHGAEEILSSREMWGRMFAGSQDRVDASAFVRARLLDILLGDWDRHRDQWRWARIPGKEKWQPIPEDRDQAFVSYEGLLLMWVRTRYPQLVTFRNAYPHLEGLTWNGRDVDRWVLAELERDVWEATARDVQARVTDEVIEQALKLMPREYYDLSAERLSAILKERRDGLLSIAGAFYRFLAKEVNVNATNERDTAIIRNFSNGDVEVTVYSGEETGPPEAAYFRRRFHPEETKEIRVYLHGGDDRALSTGRPLGRIKIRVIPGRGRDEVDDSRGGKMHVYDSGGTDRLVPGPGTRRDIRPYQNPDPDPRAPWVPPRDWGRLYAPRLWPGFSTDIGLFLGGGMLSRGYSFRKYPYADSQLVRGGYATGADTFRFDYRGDFYRMNSTFHTTVGAHASGIEILHFYGFGNETSNAEGAAFYKIEQNQFALHGALNWPLSSNLVSSLGGEIKFSTLNLRPDTLLGRLQPYGAEDFGQLSLFLGLDFDSRQTEESMAQGVCAQVRASYFPGIWSVREAFGGVNGELRAYVPLSGRLMLALRGGGKQVFGDYPFHEGAFLGGSSTVRGFRRERFVGDASLYGSMELRLPLGNTILILPGQFGVFGLADVGRVFFEGESSRKWHPSVGGGFFFSVLDLATTFSLAVATSEESTSVYFSTGFSF